MITNASMEKIDAILNTLLSIVCPGAYTSWSKDTCIQTRLQGSNFLSIIQPTECKHCLVSCKCYGMEIR